MPTTPARARKWIKAGKAVGKRNKVGVFYVQLLRKPSGYTTQEIVVGTDRGKAFSGTITPFGFRSGDYVQVVRKGEVIRGWIGGFTNSGKTKNISVYDHNWSRIGQFNPNSVKLIKRSTRLCVVA